MKGKKIVIQAGLTGSGKATAIEAAKAGASIVTMSRKAPDHKDAIALMDQLGELGAACAKHIQCDAIDQPSVEKAMQEAAEFLGGIDGLVLPQGTDHIKPVAELTNEDFQADLNSAFFGTVNCCRAAYPYLKEGGGSVVTFGANAASNGLPQYEAYVAAKGAVTMYSRSLANEWGPENIRVNVVAPVVFTELCQAYLDIATPDQIALSEGALSTIVLGDESKKGFDRMGAASECGKLVLFLLSDDSQYITGQYINVDGGSVPGRL